MRVQMATGTYPLGTTNPYPCPRRKNTPAKKPMPTDGYIFVPIPVPVRVTGTHGLPMPEKMQASCLNRQPTIGKVFQRTIDAH